MTVLTLPETSACQTRHAVDRVVRGLPALGPLRLGPWAPAQQTWIADAWTPGPDLVLRDPWLSRLAGRATGVRAGTAIDSAGPREWLAVTAPGGAELLRCELLRESDFCAWDALLASLSLVPGPAAEDARPSLFGKHDVAVCRAARAHRQSVGCVFALIDSGSTHLYCHLDS